MNRELLEEPFPTEQLRQRLRAQHVQLEWPMPTGLKEYLEKETINR